MRTVPILLLAAVLALSLAPAPAPAAPLQGLADAEAFLPSEAMFAVYVDLRRDTIDRILRMLPVPGVSMPTMAEKQFEAFEGMTGFNPLKHLEAAYLAVVPRQPGGPPRDGILAVVGTFDLGKLLPVLKKDPLLQRENLSWQTVAGVETLGNERTRVAFVSRRLLAIAKPEELAKFLEKRPAGPQGWFGADVDRLKVQAPIAVAMIRGLRQIPPEATKNAPPQIQQLVNGLDVVGLAFTPTDLVLKGAFNNAQAAQMAQQMLQGYVQMAAGQVNVLKAQAGTQAVPGSALALLNPKVVMAQVGIETAEKLVGAMQPVMEGNLLRVQVPFDKVPLLGSGGIALVGALAAIAVPNFRRARERAQGAACFANQRTLAGALEMYRLDNNAPAETRVEDVMHEFVQKGYLQAPPECSEGGSYQTMPDGSVGCSVHGQPPAGPGMPWRKH